MSVAHVLKISCNEISSLNDKIHRFWDLGVILAYDKFKSNIASERGSYSVTCLKFMNHGIYRILRPAAVDEKRLSNELCK